MRRTVAALGFLLASLPHAAVAADSTLAEARHHYEALDYEKCVAVLGAGPVADAERAEAELLTGVCQFELGHRAEAIDRFRRALRLSPRILLPPYSSPKMVDAFREADAAVRVEPAAPPAEPPRAAPASPALATRPPSTPERTHPIPLASILLGAGAVALTGVGAYSYVDARSLEGEANRARFESDAYALGDRADGKMTVATVGLLAGFAFAAAAVAVWVASAH